LSFPFVSYCFINHNVTYYHTNIFVGERLASPVFIYHKIFGQNYKNNLAVGASPDPTNYIFVLKEFRTGQALSLQFYNSKLSGLFFSISQRKGF